METIVILLNQYTPLQTCLLGTSH